MFNILLSVFSSVQNLNKSTVSDSLEIIDKLIRLDFADTNHNYVEGRKGEVGG